MTDALKMAVKAGLIISVVLIIGAVFAGLQVPITDMGYIGQSVGKGVAIAKYWFPMFNLWIGIGILLIGLEITILIAKITLIALKWIFKVNE